VRLVTHPDPVTKDLSAWFAGKHDGGASRD